MLQSNNNENMDFNQKIDKLIDIINNSENIVFFGGAGVSTESGVPDFRSKDGLYNQHDVRFDAYEPEYLLSHECLTRNKKVFYEYYRQKLDARNIEPNITHLVLAKLEEKGKLKAIVTQNIDGLHQKAGSKVVYEIHGTTNKNYCASCGKQYEADYIFESSEAVPTCACGGQIRPDVTMYGESLDDGQVSGAIDAISHADTLIIAGTSLKVYPAASFIYKFSGKYIVVVNRDKLDISGENILSFYQPMGEVFAEIDKRI